MEPLRKNIEKAIRIMSFKSKQELKTYTTGELLPIEHLFKDLNILNFDKYLQLSFGTLIWKVNNDETPQSISNLFERNQARESDFRLANINTEYKRRFITFAGIKQLKKIPKKKFLKTSKNHIRLILSLFCIDLLFALIFCLF